MLRVTDIPVIGFQISLCFIGEPSWIRTSDLCLRRAVTVSMFALGSLFAPRFVHVRRTFNPFKRLRVTDTTPLTNTDLGEE